MTQVPGTPQRSEPTFEGARETDVIIIGAGVSGLVAAREIRRSGLSVNVLEASNRVGGRTLVETSALGSRVDVGGMWVGHDHSRVRSLAREFGLEIFPMPEPRLPAIIRDGKRLSPFSWPMLTLACSVGIFALLRRTKMMTEDHASLADLIQRVPGSSAQRALRLIAQTSWTVEPERIAVSTVTEAITAQGGLRVALSTRGGAQDSLLIDGLGTIAERLAKQLGSTIHLGHRVTEINQDRQRAEVVTAQGVFRAMSVVVTAPPPMAEMITHRPALPQSRSRIEKSTVMGTVFKAIAVYDEPFWRTSNRGDAIVLDVPGCVVFDTSPPRGPGHLTLLLAGADARALDELDLEHRRDLLVGHLVRHFGERARKIASWHDKAWHQDPFVGGGYAALPRFGQADAVPSMAHEATGRVHWAGSETAPDHPGYVEGAILSGLQVAGEVIGAWF